MGGVEPRRKYQPDENAAGRSGYYRCARESTANWRRKIIDEDVPVRKSGGCGRSSRYPASGSGSNALLIALKGAGEPPLRGSSCAICPQRAAIICATTRGRGPVRLSRVENERKRFCLLYCVVWRNRRGNGDWQRRGYLCLINCRGEVWTDDLARRRRRLCRLGPDNVTLTNLDTRARTHCREQQLGGAGAAKIQAHEQVIMPALAERDGKGHAGIREGLARGLEQDKPSAERSERRFMPVCAAVE